MPSLLLAPPPTSGSALLGSIADIVLNRRRQEAAEKAQADSMARQLIESQQQQQRFQDELALRQQQAQQQQAHLAAADQMDAQRLQLERDKFDLLKADQEPVPFPSGAPSISATDAPQGSVRLNLDGTVNAGGEGLLGKITDYGQSNDETPDSYTRAGKSAIGNLRPDSMAVSPDIEEKMRAQGIKIGTPITLKLDDGTTLTRFWDDRTAGEYNGKKLTQRFDLYSPEGPSPLRDRAVVGFSVADPSSPGKSLMESFERQPVAQMVDSPARERSSMAKQLVDSFNPNRAGSDILSGIQLEAARAGMNKGDYRTMMRSAVPQLMAAQARSQISPLVPVGDGTFISKSGNRLFRATADGGIEQVQNPSERRQKLTLQGSDGKLYTQFNDGTWDAEPPEGTSLTKISAAPKPFDAVKEQRAEEDQVMQKLNTARGRVGDIERELARLAKEGKEPEWPWEKDGQFYKNPGAPKAIDEQEYVRLMKEANSTDWAKLNHELVQRRASLNSLQRELDTVATRGPAASPSPALAATDEKVSVIDPNGRSGKIPKSQLEAALQNGFSLPK